MNDMKTPEFWVTVITNIVAAVVAILAARGILSAEEGQLWVQLASAVVLPVALLVIGQVNKSYIASQAEIKSARFMAESNTLWARAERE
jgi:hypothetical protein